jgi:hypothetical protein
MATIRVAPSGKWKIAVYGREHGVPHFHLIGPDFDCLAAIASMEIVIGHAPKAVLREALAWARGNRAAMLRIWKEQNR